MKDRKDELRKALLDRMQRLDVEQRRLSDEAIVRRLLSLPEYARAGSVFCFVGAGAEIDTLPIIEAALAAGKQAAVPLCTGPGLMEPRLIASVRELAPGAYGIPAPPASAPPLPAPDLAVVPCLACDRRCRRLGRGGGFYDRFLAGFAGTALALCREDFLLEEVPVDSWDIAVGAVVTERAVYWRPG
jgi:5-formyltetrahydrofolate cyclo-ligase